MKEKVIGFIGIGYMGSLIVEKLLKEGYQVYIYNRTKEKAFPLVEKGAVLADSIKELTEQADIIMSSLSNDQVVEKVYLGEQGVMSYLKAGASIVELSSIKPGTTKKIYDEAKKKNVSVLDVAISGSTPVLEKGEVILLVGGNKEDYEKMQDLLSIFSKMAFYMGESGKGETMKLVVNTLLGIEMAGLAEAVRLGEALGLEKDKMLDVLAHTAVLPKALVGKLENLKNNSYPTQFKAELMKKDLDNVLDEERKIDLRLSVTHAADEEYAAIKKEHGDKDFSSIFTAIR